MDLTEITRLASATNALRPDWAHASLVTFITRDLSTRAYRDAAIALAWIACDPDTQTPGRVLENGPWWDATTAGVGKQTTPTAPKLDGLRCSKCGLTVTEPEHQCGRIAEPGARQCAFDALKETT